MTKWIPALLLAFCVQGLSAQSNKVILLKNHNLYLENTLEEGLTPLQNEQNQSNIYRLVQFNSVDQIKIGDKTNSYEVLEYIPKNAFLIRISRNTKSVTESLKGKGAISASAMDAQWKLSKRLFQQNIPEWAFTDKNEVKVWVKYYKGINHQTVVTQLKKLYTVSDENPSEEGVQLTISPDKILQVAAVPFLYYVQEMEDPGAPENYTARTSHRANSLQSIYPGAPSYDGTGVMVGHGDDGEIGPHIDYTGRMTQSASPSTGDHGDHVAGTIFGAGNLDPTGQGMAPGAEIFYQTYPNNLSDADLNYNTRNVRVTVSSYSNGCNAGYTFFTRQMDQDAIDNPNLIHVFSAGNSGTSNCGYGAGNTWGNITGGHKIAKNVIAVGNLTNVDVLASSSSRGPADDGRIKPDVAGVGTSVYSTTNPNLYTLKTGTSMSCPGVGGVLSVLYEAYRDHNQNADPKSGLLKAILMNTSDDLGNPGPDFRHGYGRVNTRRAYEVIAAQNHITDNITQGASKSFQIQVPANTAEVRVMLYWPDVPAATISSRALVNDLNMDVVQNNTTYLPWVLDPTPNVTALNSNAVRAVDSLNNAEQVTLLNPAAGDITVNVDGTTIPGSSQEFYIVYEFVPEEIVITYPMGGDALVPGESEIIRWDAPSVTGTFTVEYSDDDGSSWNSISGSVPATRRHLNWNVPNVPGGNYRIRVSNGNWTSESLGTFTVSGVPSNLRVASACPDSIQIKWDPVNGATSYIIYKLGAKYMDSIATSLTAFANVPNNLNQGDWYSVAAVTSNNGLGRRAFAFEYQSTGTFNCQLDDDLKVATLLSPAPGYLPDCFNFTNVPVTVRLSNNGSNPIFNFDVSYQLNSGAIVTETITDTIPVNGSLEHTFSGSSVSLSIGNSYAMSVWTSYAVDDNNFNDSLSEDIALFSGTSVSFPYSNDFENFANCGTANDCGATTCNLADGWLNPANGAIDDIDWRTNNGNTPSGSTGPSQDQNPGTSAGKYLYLEASNGCDSNLAQLLSPCIDLSTANSPLLEFGYHMNGADMGVLTVDIFDGTEWHLSVFRISGNRGNIWRSQIINLLDYAGKTIMLRFNGKTGNDFASDLSLDNINLYENTVAPTASFLRSNGITCIDGVVELTDRSTNIPTTWEWIISPNTFSFVNGTDSASQNASVQFHSVGVYSVSLVSTNAFGSDTTQSLNVTVDPGAPVPVFEDFESTFTPLGWSLDNPDGQTQWSTRSVVGSNGSSTKAAIMDNFNGGSSGQYDGLVTLNLDLRNTVNPIVIFDVAYAQKSSSRIDSLIIDASFDCGFTYMPTTYQKGGSGLSTASQTASFFAPNSASDWRRDTLDLAAYIGNNVKLRFRNYSDGGNAVYLDNIQIVSGSVVAPSAFFTTPDSLICNNDMILFTDGTSGGMATIYDWDFTNNAIPNSANTAGPHSVRFINNGTYTVTLTVSNSGGFSQHTFDVYVEETPLTVFSETFQTVQTIQFNDLSTNDPTEWKWYFGDGDSSSVQNPTHTYVQDGTYTVELISGNRCGSSTRTRQVVVQGIGLEEQIGLDNLGLYPNPSKGAFNLSFSSNVPQNLEIDVLDLTGKKVKDINYQVSSGNNQLEFDLSELSKGIYFLRLNTETGTRTLRAIKE